MSKRKSNFFLLFILILFLTSCTTSNNNIKVDQIFPSYIESYTYKANVNGEEKEISIYKHVENRNGKDVIVQNPYATTSQGDKIQLSIYEKVEEFKGTKYVMPKDKRIVNITEEGVIMVKPIAIFIDSSNKRHEVVVS